jgi:hypothetical protein
MSFSSVAEKSFTGIVTRPKEIAPFHIERGMPLVCLMLLTVAERAQRAESRCRAEGRFAAQARKEPFRQRSEGSSCSTGVKTFRLQSEQPHRAQRAEQLITDRAPPFGGEASGGVLPPQATTTTAATKRDPRGARAASGAIKQRADQARRGQTTTSRSRQAPPRPLGRPAQRPGSVLRPPCRPG